MPKRKTSADTRRGSRSPHPDPGGEHDASLGESTNARSQTDAAVDLIRSRIIDLSLGPGSRIDEPLLIQRFRLGRTPAREAMNRLVAEGFVNLLPNRGGTYVRNLDLREIGEIVSAHQMAESVLAHLCRFEDAGLLEDLEKIQSRYSKEVRQRTYLGITAVNEEFHLRMHASIRNTFFFDFAKTIHRHVRRLLVLIYKLEEAEHAFQNDQFDLNLEEHRAIIDTIRKKDREKLKELLPAHARQAQQRLLRLLSTKAIEPLNFDVANFEAAYRS